VGREDHGEDGLTHLSGSTPLPQLFPNLNKSLHLAWRWKAVTNEAAILVRLLVEISHGWQTKVSEIIAKFRKVLFAQHLRFSIIGTASHAGDSTTFVLYSPSVIKSLTCRGYRW
jgi:hypothetical protein